ncbi:hypothetical protein ACJJTC_011680, partial [Scirpophaga incertulas]
GRRLGRADGAAAPAPRFGRPRASGEAKPEARGRPAKQKAKKLEKEEKEKKEKEEEKGERRRAGEYKKELKINTKEPVLFCIVSLRLPYSNNNRNVVLYYSRRPCLASQSPRPCFKLKLCCDEPSTVAMRAAAPLPNQAERRRAEPKRTAPTASPAAPDLSRRVTVLFGWRSLHGDHCVRYYLLF